MKDQITEILRKQGIVSQINYETTAEEIESHVFEFMDWVKKNCTIIDFKDGYLWQFIDNDWPTSCGNKELYDAWFIHIHNKGIPMLPVTSSQIKSVGFKDNTLYVEFNTGDVYSYKDVPDGLFVNLRFAESVGKFFASEVKGKYDYVKTDKKVVERELKDV
jgi:hypothetical protein